MRGSDSGPASARTGRKQTAASKPTEHGPGKSPERCTAGERTATMVFRPFRPSTTSIIRAARIPPRGSETATSRRILRAARRVDIHDSDKLCLVSCPVPITRQTIGLKELPGLTKTTGRPLVKGPAWACDGSPARAKLSNRGRSPVRLIRSGFRIVVS